MAANDPKMIRLSYGELGKKKASKKIAKRIARARIKAMQVEHGC